MGESVILHAERSFLVCRKPVGVECEHELPALLAEEMNAVKQIRFTAFTA